MRVVVAVVGKPRNAALATAIRDYETRAARYWPLEVHEVREERAAGISAALVREREGERLAQRVAATRIVACAEAGKQMSSERFATWLSGERESGRDVAFVIGGAFGLSDTLMSLSVESLSLAPWTLPHELARLVLAEQLYRAGSIVRNEPYHK
ncbi:MAG: 23S rRNA (pseudouridine(1915)-N(3))-methyltransferase RlmH [Gemmatimonadaceae bacterium]